MATGKCKCKIGSGSNTENKVYTVIHTESMEGYVYWVYSDTPNAPIKYFRKEFEEKFELL